MNGLNNSNAIFLGKPVLVQTQLWTDDDDGSTGIVDALPEQVLDGIALAYPSTCRSKDFNGACLAHELCGLDDHYQTGRRLPLAACAFRYE